MTRKSVALVLSLGSLLGCAASYPTFPTQSNVVAGIVVQYALPTSFVHPGSNFSIRVYAVTPDEAFTTVTSEAQSFSSDLTVARPLSSDTFTAVEPGIAEVVVAYKGFTASMPVVVKPATRSYPYIQLSTMRFGFSDQAGHSTSVNATLRTSPSQSRSVREEGAWTSLDPSVATVDRGIVRTLKVGTAVITVTVNGLSESIYIPVAPRL